MHFRFPLIILLLLEAFPLPGKAENEPLLLKLDRTFKRLPMAPEGAAAFISANHVEAKKGEQLEAYGNVELRQDGQVVGAEHLLYGQESKDVLAEGAVRLEQGGAVLRGPVLKLNLDSDIGEMAKPQYEFKEIHARGEATTLHILGKQNYTFDDATYTTCPAGNDDWLLRMSRLDIDRGDQTGTARNARVEFMGVPILYTPWMDFPLNSNPRSGFLGPVFGSSSKGGAEFTLPYYWRIAPNYDATIAPRAIAKRGIQLNNEFRYLNQTYAGEAHYDVLPNDREISQTRSFASLKHAQNLGGGFGLALNLNRVSDDTYFRDLGTAAAVTSQGSLLRDSALSYGAGWWSATARVQRFQTLQDPLNPTPAALLPYRRQPQVNLTAQRAVASANVSLASEYVDFRHDTSVNAERMVLYPSASYPLLSNPGYYLTPKLGIHHTQYRMGANNTSGLPDASRTLPIFSVDSGMAFERDWATFFGGDYLQTLEPRLYYVYIPYRNQDALPLFDTAQAPFNFGQIFTENRFFGSDRVGDANMVTAALTSRVIDNEGGTERLRVMIAERFSIKAPKVNLVAPTENTGRSDILMSLGGRLTNAWSLDSLVQYNPNQTHVESYYAMARFRPEPGKLVNLGYRFTRDTLAAITGLPNQVRQADISTQWPLFGRWQGVARVNYSLQAKRTTEALAGLEYNQACWATRFVAQSIVTATNVRNTSIFLQLELNDLMPIGVGDPLSTLRNSIFGYTKMNGLPAEQPVQGLH